MIARTTITAESILMERVSSHVETTGETLTDFYNRAILNQLEKDGDFEIRDLLVAQGGTTDGSSNKDNQ